MTNSTDHVTLDLLECAKPLIKYMNELHPHHTCIVTSTGVEILEWQKAVKCLDFLKD
jgi:hypothetical protein